MIINLLFTYLLTYAGFVLLRLQLTEADLRNLMFGDYMNPDLDPDERVYEEVKSVEALYQVAEQSLVEYNNQSKTRMNLVIFG